MEDPFDTIRKITYTDESGELRHCEPPEYHPIHDAHKIAELRGRYQWHKLNTSAHRIVIRKKDLVSRQEQLKSGKATNALHNDCKDRMGQRHRAGKFRITDPATPSPAVPVDSAASSNQLLQVTQLGVVSSEMDTTVVVSSPTGSKQNMSTAPLLRTPSSLLPSLPSPSLWQDIPILSPSITANFNVSAPIAHLAHAPAESRLPRRFTRQSQNNEVGPNSPPAIHAAAEALTPNRRSTAQPSGGRSSLRLVNNLSSSTSSSTLTKRKILDVDTTTPDHLVDAVIVKKPRLDPVIVSTSTGVDNDHPMDMDESRLTSNHSTDPTSTPALGDTNSGLNVTATDAGCINVDTDRQMTVDEPETATDSLSTSTSIHAEMAEPDGYSHNRDIPGPEGPAKNIDSVGSDDSEQDEDDWSDSNDDYDYRDGVSLDDNEYEVEAIVASKIEVSASHLHY